MVSIFFEKTGKNLYPYLGLHRVANDTNLLYIINNLGKYCIAHEWWIKDLGGFAQEKQKLFQRTWNKLIIFHPERK